MSTYQAVGAPLSLLPVKLTGTGVVTLVAAGKGTALISLTISNITTSTTAAITVALYNGTTRWYLLYQVPVGNKGLIILDTGWPLNNNVAVEVTASVADTCDVFAVVALQPRQ